MDTMLKAAEKLTPPSSRRKKRRPYTLDFILAIRQHLDLQKPLDASVFACLSTCFFATRRVGEFTVPKLDGFNPEVHDWWVPLLSYKQGNCLWVIVYKSTVFMIGNHSCYHVLSLS